MQNTVRPTQLELCSQGYPRGENSPGASSIEVIRPNPITNTVSSFTSISEDDVLKILASSKTKTCDLDPMPASLVLKNVLIYSILTHINVSIIVILLL